MSYWKYFKENFLFTALWMLGLLLGALITIQDSFARLIASGSFGVICLILLIAAYFSWKKYKR